VVGFPYQAIDKYSQVIDVLMTNNPIDADHGWLESRLRPMRRLNGCAQRE
jgi:hypothetical protein